MKNEVLKFFDVRFVRLLEYMKNEVLEFFDVRFVRFVRLLEYMKIEVLKFFDVRFVMLFCYTFSKSVSKSVVSFSFLSSFFCINPRRICNLFNHHIILTFHLKDL